MMKTMPCGLDMMYLTKDKRADDAMDDGDAGDDVDRIVFHMS